MDIVVFADGSQEVCTYLSYLPDLQLVYIFLDGADWEKAVNVFTDIQKTKAITYSGVTIEGFTNVDYIEPQNGGMKARLSRNKADAL